MSKQGVTYLLSNIGGKIGTVDGMIGASTSQGNTTAAVSGTVTAIGSVALMFPGSVGQVGTALIVGVNLGKTER
ncbi:hypothetical protein ACFPVS_09940 [Neisseria weixii]|uniref:hypothetical protein n=2 Tax=Neisseria weixii TaxID=1853276 RepID=UPI0036215DAF